MSIGVITYTAMAVYLVFGLRALGRQPVLPEDQATPLYKTPKEMLLAKRQAREFAAAADASPQLGNSYV